MMRARTVVSAMLLSIALVGCGGGVPLQPHVDPTEQWIQAGKKVDFAIEQTKEMIQRAHGTNYLPDLHMRLAELYSERARYAWLVSYERQRQRAHGEDVKAVESPEARLLKNLAIASYGRVLREFPTYARSDEALFLTGHEYRELGDFDRMKDAYERLIATYPNSSHVLEAYLALGDHAFDASDVVTAEKYYDKILAAPPGPVHALARYKLGWIRIFQQNCRGASELFETILRDRAVHADARLLRAQKDLNVNHEALVDLAYCYPDVHPDKPPVPYFRELATSEVDYIAAMRRLASRFIIKEMRAQAAVALREVLDNVPEGEDQVDLARRLHDSVVNGAVYDHPGDDVARLTAVLDARLGDYHLDAATRTKLSSDFELYARNISTRADVAAREKKDAAVFSLVADAYEAYLSSFGNAAAAPEIRQNRAEALMGARRYYEAGRAFGELETAARTPEQRKQARLNAIAAYQQALDDPALARVERVVAWGAVRELGRRAIVETPHDPAILGIKLSVARAYYEGGDYWTAANLYYALARQAPATNEGIAAAQLTLDALRLADNLEGIETFGRRLAADTRLRDDVRKQISEIVLKAGQRQIAEASTNDTEDRQTQLLAMAKKHQGSQLGEEALYDSLLVAKANGELDRFFQTGDEFLSTYPNSPRRADVLSGLSTVASDTGDFANAGRYMSAAYAADPQAKDATDRLYAAASIHAVVRDPAAAKEIHALVERGNPKVDDLLVLLARSGSLATLEHVLSGSSINTPVATFFRGYLAFQHGDYTGARGILGKLTGAPPDLTARARFLMGEIAFAEFRAIGTRGDIATTVNANVKGLHGVDAAFRPVIQGTEIRWAMAGLARLADANAKFAAFLRGLVLPADLSPADQAALRTALEAQAAQADKQSNDLRALCTKEAKQNQLLSEAARSCLLDQPLPDAIPMYPSAAGPAEGVREPATAAPLHRALLKNTRDAGALLKLAEIHLGGADPGGALLLLERAETTGAPGGALENLRGLALYQMSESQEAGDAFQKAVSLEPGNPLFHQNLAAQEAAFGQLDLARNEARKAGAPPAAPRGPTDHPDVALLGRLGADEKKGRGSK